MMAIIISLIFAVLILWIKRLRASLAQSEKGFRRMKLLYQIEHRRRQESQRISREALKQVKGEAFSEIVQNRIVKNSRPKLNFLTNNQIMKITHIRVMAARGFNHPHEQFANFRFEIHQEAQLEEGEDQREQLFILQQQTETAAEVHKKRILEDIERQRLIEHGEHELSRLQSKQRQNDETPAEIAKIQETLAKLKKAPFILAPVTVHPGHPDHPHTDFFGR